jgi:hypothetical protein
LLQPTTQGIVIEAFGRDAQLRMAQQLRPQLLVEERPGVVEGARPA